MNIIPPRPVAPRPITPRPITPRLIPAVLIPALLVSTVLLVAAAGAVMPLSSSQQRDLDKNFVCPEKLPDDAARLQAITSFMQAYARFDGKATVNDRLAYRAWLLARHKCTTTDETHYSFPQT